MIGAILSALISGTYRGMAMIAVAMTGGVLAIWAAHASGRAPTAEPQTYRMENYHAPLPATLRGARVVTAKEAHALWVAGKTVFIDVMPKVSRPPHLPGNVLWRDKVHKTIPRSVWLPDVGYGRLSAPAEAYFRRNLQRLSGGDPHAPLLFFCLSDCWMSWNAAKRAIEDYGFRNVIWFPEGADIWEFEGYPLEPGQPEP